MNIRAFMFVTGLLLVFGAVGGINDMPPDATVTQWSLAISIAVVGLFSMFVGIPKE